MSMIRTVRKIMEDLERRVLLMIGRAVLRRVNDSTPLQTVQVEALPGEIIDGAERFQMYGITSHPREGADALVLAVGGIRQHPVVLVDDRRHRPKDLAEGEVVLYTDEDDHHVILKRGKITEMKCGTTTLTLEPAGMTLVTPSGTQRWGT